MAQEYVGAILGDSTIIGHRMTYTLKIAHSRAIVTRHKIGYQNMFTAKQQYTIAYRYFRQYGHIESYEDSVDIMELNGVCRASTYRAYVSYAESYRAKDMLGYWTRIRIGAFYNIRAINFAENSAAYTSKGIHLSKLADYPY